MVIGQETNALLGCFLSSATPAAMPRLRMKDTPQDIEAILKAERKQRRKRRREEERQRPRDDSMTPPRASTFIPHYDDLGFDESTLPPSQARKLERTDEDFNDRLRDAFEEDSGVGFREETMYSRQIGRAHV